MNKHPVRKSQNIVNISGPPLSVSRRRELTVLGLPPLHFPLGLEGRDDVLNVVAVGVAIAIVRQP